MLDAFIIDRIRREQERARQKDARLPLHIEDRQRPPPPPGDDRKEPERGSVIIDYTASFRAEL